MTGIILINFGGPKSLKGVTPFLKDIFKDILPSFLKPLAPLLAMIRSLKSKRMYNAIEGTSPVVSWTMRQAQALEEKLNTIPPPPLPSPSRGEGEGGGDIRFQTYIGMKYGHPSIDNAISEAKRDGCEKIYLLPLFIYESRYTMVPEGFELIKISHNHPLYIKCQAEIIKASLLERPHFIFSIHSIPKRSSISGLYVKQIEESVAAIMKSFAGFSYQIAYQSAPCRFGWTKPSTKTVLKQLTHQRTNAPTHCLIVPLGFACENLETIYEIDQLYIPYAKKLGLTVTRTPALNNHPLFIDMLTKLVLDSR